MTEKQMTARDWIVRAKETLDKRTRQVDDTQMLDAYDDLCHALEALDIESGIEWSKRMAKKHGFELKFIPEERDHV